MPCRSLWLVAMIGAGAIGFLAGFASRRTTVSKSPISRNPQTPPPTSDGAETADGPGSALEDREGLRKRVIEQEEEIRMLRDAQAIGPCGARLAAANQIWGAFERMQDGDPDVRLEYMKLLGQMADLGEEEAPFFVEQYRTAKDRKLATIAVGLACCCGGPEANALVRDFLQDPTVSEEERTDLLSRFLDVDGIASLKGKPFVVNDELAPVLSRCLNSANPTQRAGAASLLSGHGSPETMARLLQLAETDSSSMVRITAIRALGWNGDRDTLARLRAYRAPTEHAANYEPPLKLTIWRLEKKYPQ